MSQLTVKQSSELEKLCQTILNEPGIRFAGIISFLGRLVAGGFPSDVEPLESEEKRTMMFMQLVLEVNMRREYDKTLGPVEYLISKRGKVNMISIPFHDHLAVISAEPSINPMIVAQKIAKLVQSSDVFVTV